MTEGRPWNRLRKIGVIVLALAVIAFVVGHVTGNVVLMVLAPALLAASAVINVFSFPSAGDDPDSEQSPREFH